MVIVHRLGSAGAARYYAGAVAPGGGDAPLLGEAPGWWAGRRAPEAPVEARTLAACMPDGPARLPGLDVMFSSPKSVSVLHALADAATVAAVRRAHDEAVSAGVAYLERHACRVNVRGRVLAADGFVAAAFRHRTSRADDPHLHTHVVIANCGWGPDGRRRALHTPALYAERRGASATYHLVLRAGLTASLGVRWAATTAGRADALEVPEEVRAAFSRRRAAVLDASGSLADRRWAEHATRPPRDGLVDYESLLFGWRRRAAFLGWSVPAGLTPRVVATAPPGAHLLPASDRWSRGDLVTVLAGYWPDGADRATVEAATEQLLASAAVVARRGRFTTREAEARAERVTAALRSRPAVATGPEALGGLQREGRRVVVIARHDAAARLATARTGVAAVGIADAPVVVDGLGPRDVVVIDPAQRLPSADVERVLGAAARRGATVLRTDASAPPHVAPAAPDVASAPPRTLEVAGGDMTIAATPRGGRRRGAGRLAGAPAAG
ncbi:MAG TPA: MobF family relaxase [Acidimicrobiales bacterium]|nr:MobF family relaxase [Acidimicrobiales bacterium]